MRRYLSLLVMFLAVAGCAPTPPRAPAPVQSGVAPLKDRPVPGWPALQIDVRYVSRLAMRGYCLKVPAGTPIPETSFDSCARPDFWRGVCYIFIDVQQVAVSATREREEMRCRGYDHQGSDVFAEALRVWRERGENRYAEMLDFD